jgi:hypothetical protein
MTVLQEEAELGRWEPRVFAALVAVVKRGLSYS